ncbi:MAG: translocation/assembly module TamB domain-containing protein, partial [Pseudomonadota bacterium]
EWNAFDFEGSIRSSILTARAMSLETGAGRIAVSGSVEMGGLLDSSLVVETAWQLADTSIVGTTTIEGDRNEYVVEHVSHQPVSASVSGRVSAVAARPVSVTLEGEVAAGRLAFVDQTLFWRRLRFDFAGRLSDWRLSADADVEYPEIEYAQLDLMAVGSLDALEIKKLRLIPGVGGVLEVNGRYLLGDDAVVGSVSMNEVSLTALLGHEVEQVTGKADFSATLQPNLAVDSASFDVRGIWNGQQLEGRGAGAFSDNVVTADNVSLAIGPNVVRFDGSGSFESERDWIVAAVVDAPDLSVISPEFGGQIEGEIDVSGSLSDPRGNARLVAPSLMVGDYALRGAELTASLDDASVTLSGTLDHAVLGVEEVHDASVVLSGTRAAHQVTLRGTHALVDLAELALEGAWMESNEWVGSVRALQATALPEADHPIPIQTTRPAEIEISRRRQAVDGLCIDAADLLSSCFSVAATDSQELDIDGQFALDSLQRIPGLPDTWQVGGAVSGEVDLQGTLERINGIAKISLDGLRIARVSDDPLSEETQQIDVDVAEVVAQWQDGLLQLASTLRSRRGATLGGELTLDSWLQPDSPIAGRIDWNTNDLATLDVVVPSVRIGSGQARVSALVSGTRSTPGVQIEGALSGGEFFVLPTNTALSGVDVNLVGGLFDAVKIRASAQSGSGTASFDGSAGMGPVGPFVRGTFLATDALLADLEDVRLSASARLALGWHPYSLSVVGRACFDDTRIAVKALPPSAVRISPDAVIQVDDQRATLTPVSFRHIDVTTTLGDDVRLSGFGLKTGLSGEIRLKQFSEAPLAGYGRLELVDAAYRAYGQSLSVTRGVLDFSGPLEVPYLSLRAERDIDAGSVGIDISGSPDALVSDLFSEPERSDAEKLSLLLTGRNLSNNDQDEGANLADAAITLGLRQAFGVSSTIRNGVGLDTLTLDGSGRDGRILAGKQLSERIYLQYAYGVFDQLSSVLLRFQINDRLALESVSGEDQAFDLLYEAGSRQ